MIVYLNTKNAGSFLKKYFVFIIRFLLLYTVFQILSGNVLTAFYTPDFSAKTGSLSQEVVFGEPSSIPLLISLFIATTAYFLTQKVLKAAK
ncbi:hypothetical protein [Aeribacillus sp. FSL M8-0254]|uniref:hypothetical protein n=1 Tax=Aeribacillus sp. FSL M8-0254 TaxID=2954577 RepID=UPI0030F5AE36